ncbi:RNA-directed DNA polymerase, eukaryota [Tanacetum coccineum]|uniref:RNA-directed DNA polymerase, eukaryota n=1 Tax=Tanacetum coccineum TaxID=301880 RepID=A0ABQ5H8F0_9ASTR
MVFHNEDGNPARANIKQALGYLKDGDGDGNSQPHKGVKASANSDVMYFFTSAQDGDPSQDDVRLCLGDDLKKAQDHSQRQASLFRQLSSSDSAFLESVISLEELKDAVWGCAGSKIPGPNGFNFNFIKFYSEDIKHEFWICIKYFKATGMIANGCNPSFVVLAPKNIDPLCFSDYRPISLIGCVYKVISKILANRLAKVIASVIGPNQSAFIEGRQILNGCLIETEIIKMASIEKLKLLSFKVDFEKAFDSVNWNFLLDIMGQMGFGSKWRNWIASCLSSAFISILINGSPAKEFKLEKGLRQGDPLSPFLFLTVAEALQVSILEACNKGFYKGVSSSDVESLAAALGCSHEFLPFTYLGLPVGKRTRYCDGWNAVINRFRDRLSSWKANSLSIGGRLTIVKYVNASNSFNVGGIWCDILKAVKTIENIDTTFKNSFMVKVASGSQTSFWKDPWCRDGTRLLDIYTRLYALEMSKECRVIDR